MLLVLLLVAGLNADCKVVVFLGTDCPLARLYAPRLNDLVQRYPSVPFRAASASQQDSADEVAQFAQRLNFPFVKDAALARRLGATRSPEAFLLVGGRIVYQGRIDDQYTPGTNRASPTRRDLEEAICEVLAGQSVSVPRTEATGCYLSLDEPAEGKITFEHVAPILHGKCAACHRPGEVAPFSLLTHADTVGWAPTMREVIENGRMPPWHADPRYGRFQNDRSLTSQEKSLLLRWLDDGAPAGATEPAPPQFDEGWKIRPDVVLEMERPFVVPAEGLLDYQEFTLPTGFDKE
ncbi:MAG: thiol-disulfide isomerase, partial [Pirellulaceae bacterium]